MRTILVLIVMLIAVAGCQTEPEINIKIIPERGGTVQQRVSNGEIMLTATPANHHWRFQYWQRPGTPMRWYTRTITLPYRDQDIEVYFMQHTTIEIDI